MKLIFATTLMSALLISTNAQCSTDELDARLARLEQENASLKKLIRIESLEKENASLSRTLGKPNQITAAPVVERAAPPAVTEQQARRTSSPLDALARVIPNNQVVGSYPGAAPLLNRWSGLYVGAYASYGFGKWDVKGNQTTTSVSNGVTFINTQSVMNGDLLPSGRNIGLAFGTLWQAGRWVFGPEIDLQYGGPTSGKASAIAYNSTCIPINGCNPNSSVGTYGNIQAQLGWLGSARARIGYDFGEWLVFATGGASIAGLDFYASYVTPSLSKTIIGYTAGAGIEYAINPEWSLRGEYQYVGLPTVSSTTNYPGTNPLTIYSSMNPSVHLLKAGVDWKFMH